MEPVEQNGNAAGRGLAGVAAGAGENEHRGGGGERACE